jgi:hypothetical protein
MAKRTLKLPDGGTINLPIPEGFGSPILAGDDKAVGLSGNTLRIISIGLIATAIIIWWKARKVT